MTFDKSRHHINAGGTPYIGDLLEVNLLSHLSDGLSSNISCSGELRTKTHGKRRM